MNRLSIDELAEMMGTPDLKTLPLRVFTIGRSAFFEYDLSTVTQDVSDQYGSEEIFLQAIRYDLEAAKSNGFVEMGIDARKNFKAGGMIYGAQVEVAKDFETALNACGANVQRDHFSDMLFDIVCGTDADKRIYHVREWNKTQVKVEPAVPTIALNGISYDSFDVLNAYVANTHSHLGRRMLKK